MSRLASENSLAGGSLDGRRSVWPVIALSAGLLVIDFKLGPLIQFPILFVLPVMWAAWRHGWRMSCGLALSLAAGRFLCHWYWGFPLKLTAAVINNVLRAGGLVAVAVATAQVAGIVHALRKRVTLLEARLPVCVRCGIIQGEDGVWRPLGELPVSSRRHVCCPSCEDKFTAS